MSKAKRNSDGTITVWSDNGHYKGKVAAPVQASPTLEGKPVLGLPVGGVVLNGAETVNIFSDDLERFAEMVELDNPSWVEDTLDFLVYEGVEGRLLRTIADEWGRIGGAYQVGTPKQNLEHNILVSLKIAFGNVCESLVSDILVRQASHIPLEASIVSSSSGDALSLDGHFRSPDSGEYFAEIKMRDDHDSTKRRGQWNNFFDKLVTLNEGQPEKPVIGYMYFIDDEAGHKNQKYYEERMEECRNAGYSVHLIYGKDFYDTVGYSEGREILEQGIRRLKERKSQAKNGGGNLVDHERFVKAGKELTPRQWGKILSNDELWQSGIMQSICRKTDLVKIGRSWDKHTDRRRSNAYKKWQPLLVKRLSEW